jgi:hypothetical protein
MERGRPDAWRTEELGARYSSLIPQIVAFRADIQHTTAKFKLGQNERMDVLQDAIRGLERDGLPALAAAMQAANTKRLDSFGQPAAIESRPQKIANLSPAAFLARDCCLALPQPHVRID